MILVDFAHLCNRYVYTAVANAKPAKIKGKFKTSDYSGLFLHGVITNILYLIKDFSKSYGDIVLALEGKSWRKKIYPEYKSHRSESRSKSEIEWGEIYEVVDDLINNMKLAFNIKVLKVNDAEGDDVIAILAKHLTEKSLIVSSDKDFKQLLKYPHIDLYDPIKRTYVDGTLQEIEENLLYHIIHGDETDNIPNILSRDKFTPEFISFLQENEVFVDNPLDFFNLECSNTLVEKYDIFEKYQSGKNKGKDKTTKAIFKKQALRKSTYENVLERLKNPDEIWLKKQFELNETLIDFSKIPKEIEKEILAEFKNTENSTILNPMGMMNFCLKYKLSNLMKDLQKFY